MPSLQPALKTKNCFDKPFDPRKKSGTKSRHLRTQPYQPHFDSTIFAESYRLFWIWSFPASFFRSLLMFSSCLLRCDNRSRRSSCMTVLAVSSATWCMIGVNLSSSLCRISASSRRTSSSRNDSTRFHLLRSLFAIGRGIPSSVSTFPACRAQRAHSQVRSQRKRSKLMQRRW